MEYLGYNKYRIKVEWSGRITKRKRQFLRKFTPRLPGPSPHTSYCEPRTYQPVESQSYQPVDSQSHQPVESQSYQPFEPPPTRQGHEPISPPRTPRDISHPDSPTSPSFETPPSSPVHNPEAYTNGPEPETSQNLETPTIPRRSTQVSRPPEKLAYDKDFKVIMKPVVNPAQRRVGKGVAKEIVTHQPSYY